MILMTVDQHPEDYAPPPQPPTRDEVLEECAAFCDIVGEPWMAAKMRASKGGSELWEASPSPTERAAAPRGPCRFHGMGGDVAESCSRVPDCPSRVRRTAPTETPQEGEKK